MPKAEGASGAMPTDGSIGADTESGFQLGAFAFGVPPLAPLGVMAAKLVAGLGQAPQPEGVEAGGEAGAEVQPEDPFPPAGADAAKPPAKKRGRKKAAEAGVAAAGADGTDAAPPKQRKPRKPKAAVPDAAAATGAAQEANGLSAPHFAPLGWVPPLPATSGANDAAAIAPILRESEGLVSLFETGASAQPGDDGAKAGAGLPPPGGTAIGLMSGADTGDRAQAKAATAAPPAADASLLEPLVSLGSLLRPLVRGHLRLSAPCVFCRRAHTRRANTVYTLGGPALNTTVKCLIVHTFFFRVNLLRRRPRRQRVERR